MDKNYYIEYYDLERNNWWFKARLEILKSIINQKTKNNHKPLKILNIGVATGATSVMLEEFGSVKSVEFDTDCYNFVKERLNIDLEQGSILDLQFTDNCFDLVCAFDVIEHVEDDKLAASEMLRVCKPNGLVFATVPAFMSLWSQHDVVNHHFKRYKLNTFKGLFGSNTLVKATYFNSSLFVPIYMVRSLANAFPKLFKREGSGSDFDMFKSGILNSIFYAIFILEKPLLLLGLNFPFGVSAMAMFRKK